MRRCVGALGAEEKKKTKGTKKERIKEGFGFGHMMEDKWSDSIGPL